MPATIAADVTEKLNQLIDATTGYRSSTDFELRALLRECDKLANADAFSASLNRAYAVHLTGDLDSAKYWLTNAGKFPGSRLTIAHAWTGIHCNLGFFAIAANSFASLPPDVCTDREHLASLGLLCGAFSDVIAKSEGTSVAGPLDDLVRIARRSTMVLETLKVDRNQMAAVLDAAGEVLRRHKLLFAGELPVVHTLDDADGVGMLYQYVVPVDCETADAMTNEVIDLLIDRDLDRLGIAFSFVPKQ
jgi:hypothetical protein